MSHTGSLGLPPIMISIKDLRRLSVLGLSNSGAARLLAREIDRATVVPVHQMLPGVVRMGSRVTFRDEATGQVQDMTLVYPRELDGRPDRLSVLTAVGAALLGLSVGQAMAYFADGERRSLLVLDVRGPGHDLDPI